MNIVERSIISGVLVAVGVYLKSPIVALMPVVLHAIIGAKEIFTKAARDEEIAKLVADMEDIKKKLKSNEMEIVNVSERAKTILGEQY